MLSVPIPAPTIIMSGWTQPSIPGPRSLDRTPAQLKPRPPQSRLHPYTAQNILRAIIPGRALTRPCSRSRAHTLHRSRPTGRVRLPAPCCLIALECHRLPLCDSPSALLDMARFSATSADRLCHVQTISPVATDWAHAPQVRHTSSLFISEYFYLFQCFPHLSPPPSGSRLGILRGRFEWIETLVQSVGLTFKLLSTTHSPTPAKTWTGRTPRLTLLVTS